MDGLAGVVGAADSPYAIIAIALIGLYALGWRWGGKMLDRMDENARMAKVAAETAKASQKVGLEAKEIAAGVAEAIVTNHGSRNLGDAVDRITAWLIQHMDESKEGISQLHALQQAVLTAAVETEQVRADITKRFTTIDKQLESVDVRLFELETSR